MSDGETKVYPKGGPAAPRDDDATKVYPKAGEPGAASRASDDATKVYGDAPRTPEPVAQSTHAEQGEPGRPKRKGVLVASIVGLVLVAGAGWWAMNEHRARLQAEAKAVVELAAAAEAKAVAETRAVGQTFRDCAECPEMVVIPAGSFEMGSNENFTGIAEVGERYKPVHTVRIGKSFALGKTEVTRGQFAAFVSASGYDAGNSCWISTGGKWGKDTAGRNWRNPGFSQSEADPVTCVNWEDAQAYVRWLSQESGKSYRLPSEAEWEYACKAGSTQAYCGSDNLDSVAW